MDFALIGHQECWENINRFMQALRGEEAKKISLDEIKEIYPWIPPRTVFRVKVTSLYSRKQIKGVYIDSFIPPDHLKPAFLRSNLHRVQEAAAYASREKAKIAALGGFTSIVLEGNILALQTDTYPVFTTGNTLTVAFICKGVERACQYKGVNPRQASLLIIGSTGDIGSGCLHYFAKKFQKILLCAQHSVSLNTQREAISSVAENVMASTNANDLIPLADIIICAASVGTPQFDLSKSRSNVIVCDAGYPKNIDFSPALNKSPYLFYGGMGRVQGGIESEPDLPKAFYQHPLPHIVHGCLLEAIVLALEERYEPYSSGRGNIRVEKIEEIYRLAQKHHIVLAPFFNAQGLLSDA